MIEKKTLPNGVRLVYEPMESVQSAAVGLWVGHGSRYEPARFGGISHAIEHMLFKGTETRTSAEVAQEMDAIGGQVNAFTTKESTCFYARSLHTHLPKAMELLGDIFQNPRMDAADWETERGVIIEEIGMYEDSPEDLVSEKLFSAIYPDVPLGRPILGTVDTLNGMSAEDILEYKNNAYVPSRLVVSLAGKYTDSHRAALETMMSGMQSAPAPAMEPCVYRPAITLREKPIEQNHLCIAFPGIQLGHPKRYTQSVLSGILGSGMSSRLFQKVREDNGLCYSIYTFTAGHLDTGVLGVYIATGKHTEEKAITLCRQVIEDFTKNGPTDEELTRVREQMKANLLMSMESTSARMNHLGQNELMLERIYEPDDIVRELDAVTSEGITELARELFDFSKVSFSAVGQVDGEDFYKGLLRDCAVIG